MIPACLPNNILFDSVYLSTVDYAVEEDALVGLLAGLRLFMNDGAKCLFIPASFQDTPVALQGKVISFARKLINICRAGRYIFKLRPRGQFWGYSRT